MSLAKLATCIVACLFFLSLAQAQIVNVNAGSTIETEDLNSSSSYTIFNFQVLDPTNTNGVSMYTVGVGSDGVNGFRVCAEIGCTSADIKAIGTSSPFYAVGPGTMWSYPGSDGTVPLFCWPGSGGFTYVSGFNHTYDSSTKLLTVHGVVTSTLEFALSDYATCNPLGPIYAFSGNWRYTAQFTQRFQSLWYLTQMQIVPFY